MIEKFLGLEVQSERVFYRNLVKNLGGKSPAGFHIPDLLCPLPEGQGYIAIEVELHEKSKARYERLWNYYRESIRYEGDRVLYLTPDVESSARLRELARKFGAEFVYFGELGAFRERFGRAIFFNFRGREFLL